MTMAQEIMTTFVLPNSPHELNLSASLRKELMDNYEKAQADGSSFPADFFSNAQTSCFVELKEDSFPRFVRSDTFKKFVSRELKKDSGYLTKIGQRKSQIVSDPSRKSQEYVAVDDVEVLSLGGTEPYITEDDVILAKRLSSEPHEKMWKLVSEENASQTYLLRDMVQIASSPKQRHINLSRIDCLLPFNTKNVLYAFADPALSDKVQKSKSTFVEYRTSYNNQPLPYATSVQFEKRNIPFFASRTLVLGGTCIPMNYNKEKKEFEKYLTIFKSIEHSDYPPTNSMSAVRSYAYNVYVLEKRAENLTSLTMILAVDPMGFLSSSAVISMVQKQSSTFVKEVTKVLREKMKTSSWERQPVNSDGILDGIRYYIRKNIDENEEWKNGTNFDTL